MDFSGITILGLGPGEPGLLTRQAWQVLESSPEIYLRTRQHPVVSSLPETVKFFSFDDLYEDSPTFEQVYEKIVLRVLELGRRPQGVIYAVPGHPYVAEATSPEIIRRAQAEQIPVRIIEGLSFLEPACTALEIDPLPTPGSRRCVRAGRQPRPVIPDQLPGADRPDPLTRCGSRSQADPGQPVSG